MRLADHVKAISYLKSGAALAELDEPDRKDGATLAKQHRQRRRVS